MLSRHDKENTAGSKKVWPGSDKINNAIRVPLFNPYFLDLLFLPS